MAKVLLISIDLEDNKDSKNYDDFFELVKSYSNKDTLEYITKNVMLCEYNGDPTILFETVNIFIDRLISEKQISDGLYTIGDLNDLYSRTHKPEFIMNLLQKNLK